MRVTLLVHCSLLLLICSCTSGPTAVPPLTLLVTTDGDYEAGHQTFHYEIAGGTAPYTVTFDLDEASVQNPEAYHPHVHATPPDTPGELIVAFKMETVDAPGFMRITVTDSAGQTADWETNYIVPASTDLRQPSITQVNISDSVEDPAQSVMTVELAGTPGLPATVTASAPHSLLIEPAGQTVTFSDSGSALAEFVVNPIPLETGSVEITVAVAGPLPVGGHDEKQVLFNLPPAWEPADDTLYAIPLQTEVKVGEPVRIVVLTGRLPNPFQYMTGVRVCFPVDAGAAIFENMNPGAPGGDGSEFDGIWALVEPAEWSLMPDSFNPPWIETGDGRLAFDFTLAPLGGHDVLNASGALFNFEVTFDNAGIWPITFQQFQTVNRTYYNDENQTPDYLWGDISNDHPGIPNSVTVTP